MAENLYPNTTMSGASFTSDDSLAPPCGGYDHHHETGNFEPSDFLQMDDWLDADFSSFSHLLNYMPNELELDSSRTSNGGFSEEPMNMINSKQFVRNEQCLFVFFFFWRFN